MAKRAALQTSPDAIEEREARQPLRGLGAVIAPGRLQQHAQMPLQAKGCEVYTEDVKRLWTILDCHKVLCSALWCVRQTDTREPIDIAHQPVAAQAACGMIPARGPARPLHEQR